ncbi:MAG TPA: DoxX family protein [Thermoanaerobaculia bacterium]
MSIFEPLDSPWTGRMLSILRIVTGSMFVATGTMILFNFPRSPVPIPPFDPLSQTSLGWILQTFGGLAIAAGFLTRPVAFLLAGEMAVAYFQFHFPNGFFPSLNGGQPAALYCFIFLYLVFAGAGPWSVDAWIAKRRRAA